MAVAASREDARAAVLALLGARATEATVCPSEVARVLAGKGDWRAEMARVHDAVDALAAEGAVRLSWKGEAMVGRAGPYRIGRGAEPLHALLQPLRRTVYHRRHEPESPPFAVHRPHHRA